MDEKEFNVILYGVNELVAVGVKVIPYLPLNYLKAYQGALLDFVQELQAAKTPEARGEAFQACVHLILNSLDHAEYPDSSLVDEVSTYLSRAADVIRLERTLLK